MQPVKIAKRGHGSFGTVGDIFWREKNFHY
jgi:hypothetical protein